MNYKIYILHNHETIGSRKIILLEIFNLFASFSYPTFFGSSPIVQDNYK